MVYFKAQEFLEIPVLRKGVNPFRTPKGREERKRRTKQDSQVRLRLNMELDKNSRVLLGGFRGRIPLTILNMRQSPWHKWFQM